MSFAWPQLLWLLAVPAALLAWELSRRRLAASEAHPKMLRARADSRHLALVPRHAAGGRVRPWLAAGLALTVVALARPQWGRIEEQVFDQSREILLAVDLSRSMLAQDVKPSRLERSKLLIQSLLERLEGERVGLVVFSGTAFLQSPLSADYEILREFLPALNPDYLPEGGTNYRALIDTTVQAFGAGTAADRFLIVLSDGEATDDDWKSGVETLKKKGIRVIGLGVGTSAGAMIPDGAGGFVKDDRGAVVLSKLENGTLQELAQATGGTYRDASTWIDLPSLLEATVEAGRKGDFVEKNQVRLVERFQWALAPALLCLLVSFWREFPVRPRPREMALGTDSREKKAGAVTAAVALGLLAFTFGHPLSARAAEEGDALVAPLSKVVGRLANEDRRLAADWAELGRTTLTYGQRLQSSKQAVPEGPVRDALAGVDAGEASDAKAADWPQLRRDLEALLKKSEDDQQKPPPEQKNQQQQQQQNKDQQQDQQQQQQKQQDQSQKSPDQQNQQQQDQQQQQQQDQNQSDQKNQQDASQDRKDQQQPKPESASSGENQKVGGAPEKKSGDEKDLDPALTLPLQKLDQLRNQDSPAKLFQIMEGDQPKPPTPKNGKNW
ncbi:MAG TPA: VWA domain-containing protein [Opitutaceae bacterium]|nr:VWA domain-containing protein [Opitutaceae bacterium]